MPCLIRDKETREAQLQMAEGMYVIVVRVVCPAIVFCDTFHYSTLSSGLDGPVAFHLIYVHHRLDGKSQPDSVASLVRTTICLTAVFLVSRHRG
jgi:hypothetical protein